MQIQIINGRCTLEGQQFKELDHYEKLNFNLLVIRAKSELPQKRIFNYVSGSPLNFIKKLVNHDFDKPLSELEKFY